MLGAGGDECWSEEEFAAFAEDIDCVVNFMANEPLMIANTAGGRMLVQIESAAERAAEGPGADIDLIDILINFYAFLTSMRSFVDQADRTLLHQFGKDSQEREAFKSFLGRLYDSSAPYRFLYGLRNYTQHRSVPLQRQLAASMELIEAGTPNERVEAVFDVCCDREALLEDRTWKPIVSDWLKGQPRFFPIKPIIAAGLELLRVIAIDFHALRAPSIMAAHGRLRPFWEAFRRPPAGLSRQVTGEPGYMVLNANPDRVGTVVEFNEIPRLRYEQMTAAAARLLDDSQAAKFLVRLLSTRTPSASAWCLMA